jgi:ubiquinone biosynthesis protein
MGKNVSILTLPKAYGNFMRLREIAGVLIRHGFGAIVTRIKLADYIPGFSRLKIAVEPDPKAKSSIPMPVRVVQVLEELGPTFIKFGQLLATRPDIIPPAYLNALIKLQDNVEPFDGKGAIKTIEKAFKADIDSVFKSFNLVPKASGSIGQVHFATLHGGREVVVKVKRPGTDKQVREDLELLVSVADLFEKHIPELAVLHPKMLCEEFARTMRRELDFVSEASYTAKFKENIEKSSNIIVPEIIWDYVSRDVLVMERIYGTPLSTINREDIAPAQRKQFATSLGEAFMRQFFVTGLFHADPHPGNIFVTDSGKIALLDFGQAGHLSGELRQHLALSVAALSYGEFDTIADIYSEIGALGENTDMRDFKVSIISLIDRYYGVPVNRIDFGQVFEELLNLTREHGIILPREMVSLCKSFVTVIGVAQELDKNFRMDSVASPFVSEMLRKEFNPKKLFKGSAFTTYKAFAMLRKTPRDLHELLQKAKEGRLRVIFHHEALENLTSRIGQATNRISLAMVIGAIIIGSSMVMTSTNMGTKALPVTGETPLSYILGVIGFGLAMILGLGLIWGIIRSDK